MIMPRTAMLMLNTTSRNTRHFVRDFREFRTDIEAAEPDHLFIAEFSKWINNWWLLHIQKVDQGLGAFLKGVFPILRRMKQ
ncbi:MAG TPA: hypothetical protein VLH56_05940 [Dissulfurispiraceae bacterium]|nr:hypothetical protein [Dissulfurispiraceae bacterium]